MDDKGENVGVLATRASGEKTRKNNGTDPYGRHLVAVSVSFGDHVLKYEQQRRAARATLALAALLDTGELPEQPGLRALEPGALALVGPRKVLAGAAPDDDIRVDLPQHLPWP